MENNYSQSPTYLMQICHVKILSYLFYLMYYKSTYNQIGDWTLPSAEFKSLSIFFKNVLAYSEMKDSRKCSVFYLKTINSHQSK